MTIISAYLSSANTHINLGPDTVLKLSEPIVVPIIFDFKSKIEISKNDLQGVKIQLNNETFNPVDVNKDDITIFIDAVAQSTNALSNLLNRGTLTVERTTVSSRIRSVIAYKDDLTTEEVMALDIVQHVHGNYQLLSVFNNENEVVSNLKETLNEAIRDKNIANVNSMVVDGDPTNFSWKQGINPLVDNTMNIFESIAVNDSERLDMFNSDNNYTVDLSELLKPDDTLSFVVSYTQNQGQKTFYGTDPPPREPTKLCITIIVKN